MLLGTEVKSLRDGKANLSDAYATERSGELWLLNSYIAEYPPAQRFNHEPRRDRKLLLHKRQIDKLLGQVKNKGVTLIPLSLYFNDKGKAKVKLGLAHGKKQYEKRETLKDRDWLRDKQRMMKHRED